jgi:hypothetical protein
VGSSKNNGHLFGRKGQKMQQNAIYQRNDKDTSKSSRKPKRYVTIGSNAIVNALKLSKLKIPGRNRPTFMKSFALTKHV